MDRFPMLTTYRALLNGVAILLLIAGLFIAIDAARTPVGFRGETEFQFGVFLLTFIPFGIGAFMIAAFAELIGLFLSIEDRLYHIQSNTTPKQSAPIRASGKTSSEAERNAPPVAQPSAASGARIATTSQVVSSANARKVLATVTAADRTLIYQRPNKAAPPHRIAVFGENIDLVARTDNCAWAKIDASYDGWINTTDLTLHGDIYDLPVAAG